jgi:hypothetical protein
VKSGLNGPPPRVLTLALLESERIYVDLFARSGKWRAKRLPREVVEEEWRQRTIHKSARLDPEHCPCSGCTRLRNGFEVVADFSGNRPAPRKEAPGSDLVLDRLRAQKEELKRRPKIKMKKK